MGRKKSSEEIIEEKETIVINEKDIITENVKNDEVIDVEASNVIIENDENKNTEVSKDVVEDKEASDNNTKIEEDTADEEINKIELVDLEILVAFQDKYTKEEYTVGDKRPFEKTRAAELLSDKRKLVKLASK